MTDSHGTISRTYDALNRVTSYTDTYGKVIRYEYDAVDRTSTDENRTGLSQRDSPLFII
ncbi:MAG: RHS repeat protein [Clostridia bacterium]|nr:RHS repeat protein [Clostridia bacterium]